MIMVSCLASCGDMRTSATSINIDDGGIGSCNIDDFPQNQAHVPRCNLNLNIISVEGDKIRRLGAFSTDFNPGGISASTHNGRGNRSGLYLVVFLCHA